MRAREVLQKARTTRGAGKMAEMAVCVCALPSPFVVGQAAGSAGVRAHTPDARVCAIEPQPPANGWQLLADAVAPAAPAFRARRAHRGGEASPMPPRVRAPSAGRLLRAACVGSAVRGRIVHTAHRGCTQRAGTAGPRPARGGVPLTQRRTLRLLGQCANVATSGGLHTRSCRSPADGA